MFLGFGELFGTVGPLEVALVFLLLDRDLVDGLDLLAFPDQFVELLGLQLSLKLVLDETFAVPFHVHAADDVELEGRLCLQGLHQRLDLFHAGFRQMCVEPSSNSM